MHEADIGDNPDGTDEEEGRTNPYREEVRNPTFDIVRILRERRLRWVGHVLRMDENRLIRKVLLRSFASERRTQAGSIWMDVPQSVDTEEELLRLAGEHGEHAEWNDLVRIAGGRDPLPAKAKERTLSKEHMWHTSSELTKEQRKRLAKAEKEVRDPSAETAPDSL